MDNTAVLAIAAGKKITNEDVDALIARLPQQQQAYASNPQFRAQALQQLIDTALFEKKAYEDGLDQSEEFQRVLDAVKAELLSRMAIANLVEAVKISDEEKLAFFEENKEKFTSQPSVSAKHILTDKEEDCLKALEEINAGEKTFEEAAVAYSTCPSSAQGGDLGTFGHGQMVPEFDQAAFAADVESIVGPVKTQFGYHLIYVYDKNDGEAKVYEEVKDQADNMALNSKQQKEFAAAVEDLAARYGLERM